MISHENHGKFALIPTHNRHAQLTQLVRSLDGDVTDIVVIDNASEPRVDADTLVRELSTTSSVHVIFDLEQPPNLSRMWNVGFNVIEVLAHEMYQHERWSIAVLNDDTELPSGWFGAVDGALREGDAGWPAIACGALHGGVLAAVRKTERDGNVMTRMTPHAFIIRGELGLRADERLRWWWGDTDLDWQARAVGGVLIIPGYIAKNTCANGQTVGELLQQAGRDRHTFAEKWGGNPW